MVFKRQSQSNIKAVISARMAIIRNLQTTNAGEDVKKRETSCTVGGNVNWYSHYGEQYGDFFKN